MPPSLQAQPSDQGADPAGPLSADRARLRFHAAAIALGVTSALTVLKVGVAVLSGSVGVLSESIHSALDLVSAAVAWFTIREAGKPADADHPFGHGRIETLSSLLESLLLIAAGGFVLYEAADHYRNPRAVQHEGLAILVIAISLVASAWAFRHNFRASRETESSAIHVNALHFLSDVVASGGVLLGLVLMKFTGWQIIDPLIAAGVGIYILAISVKQVRGTLLELADSSLPDTELAEIRSVLERFRGSVVDMHDLRSRRTGATRHLDFHLVVCGHLSVRDSHATCDEIEAAIDRIYPHSSVSIHVEPCEHEGIDCLANCPYRDAERNSACPRPGGTPLPRT